MDITAWAPIVVALIGAVVSIYGIWRLQRSEKRAAAAAARAAQQRLEVDKANAAAAITEAASKFIGGLQAEIEAQDNRITRLEKVAKELRQENLELTEKLAATERDLDRTRRELRSAVGRMDELARENERLRNPKTQTA